MMPATVRLPANLIQPRCSHNFGADQQVGPWNADARPSITEDEDFLGIYR